jgi:hypothetical protein
VHEKARDQDVARGLRGREGVCIRANHFLRKRIRAPSDLRLEWHEQPDRRGKDGTPLSRRSLSGSTGYPWAGCSPAEPACVSPDVKSVQRARPSTRGKEDIDELKEPRVKDLRVDPSEISEKTRSVAERVRSPAQSMIRFRR